jgi:hypothetical protein
LKSSYFFLRDKDNSFTERCGNGKYRNSFAQVEVLQFAHRDFSFPAIKMPRAAIKHARGYPGSSPSAPDIFHPAGESGSLIGEK